jgi:ribosomal-protein-serine acetyltransferase
MSVIQVKKDLFLRQLTPDDAQQMFALVAANREFLRRYLSWVDTTLSESDTLNFITSAARESQEGITRPFGIWFQERLIGHVSLMNIVEAHQAEIGYWLSQSEGGKGIMTLAIHALCDYAFNTLQLERLLIRARVGNDPSASIARRLGFVSEGIERAGERHGNSLFDIERFSRLRRHQ